MCVVTRSLSTHDISITFIMCSTYWGISLCIFYALWRQSRGKNAWTLKLNVQKPVSTIRSRSCLTTRIQVGDAGKYPATIIHYVEIEKKKSKLDINLFIYEYLFKIHFSYRYVRDAITIASPHQPHLINLLTNWQLKKSMMRVFWLKWVQMCHWLCNL